MKVDVRKIETILFQKHLRKTDVAKKIGMSRSAFSAALNIHSFADKHIKNLAEAMGVNPAEFILVPGDNIRESSLKQTQQNAGELDTLRKAYEDSKANYERIIADKVKIIQVLEDRIEDLKKGK